MPLKEREKEEENKQDEKTEKLKVSGGFLRMITPPSLSPLPKPSVKWVFTNVLFSGVFFFFNETWGINFTPRSKDHNKKTCALDFHSYELTGSREFYPDQEGQKGSRWYLCDN